MLYISRLIGDNKHGVVYSETGVEHILTYKELCELYFREEVKGVKRCVSGLGISIQVDGKTPLVALDTIPYQGQPLTRQQLKARLMYPGVDIVLYNSIITHVSWDIDKFKDPVFIRLSSFGCECGDFMLCGSWFMPSAKPFITFILDDKVKVTSATFSLSRPERCTLSFKGLHAYLDVREVTSKSAARCVYNSVWSNCFSVEDFEMIVDDEDRKNRMIKRFERLDKIMGVVSSILLVLAFPITVIVKVVRALRHVNSNRPLI